MGGCTRFFYKDEGKFLQNVWKNQLQTFSIRCFSIFIFLHLDVLFSIPGEGKIFFLVFDKEGVDGKMFVKVGYPGWGWGDTCARLGCRLPPHLHAPTRWKKIKKIAYLSFLQIPKLL